MIESGPDEILLVPVDELADSLPESENTRAPRAHTQMRSGPDFPTGQPKKRRRGGAIEHPALDLYAGYSLLLVRTALLRAEGWTPNARRPTVSNAWDAAQLLEHLKWADQEHLVTISLDNHNQVNAIHEVAIGHATGTMQTPGNILKVAFLTSARALIIAHNHPSGVATPSRDDLAMTAALLGVGECVGVHLLDALVVGHDGWVSLRDLAENMSEWSASGMAHVADRDSTAKAAALRRTNRWPG